MFKITFNTFQIRNLLLRSRPSGIQVAQYSRSTPCNQFRKVGEPERDICKEPPKPVPPPKDDRLLWSTIAAIIVTGSFAFYAKGNPELRDWITIHAPWFDDLIAVINQENYNYTETAMRLAGDIKNAIGSLMDTRECTVDEFGNAVYVVKEVAEKQDTCHDEEESTKEAVEAMEEDEKEEKEDDGVPCLEPPIPTITNICEMEACVKEIGDENINNYMTARDACVYYNKLVSDTMLNFTYPDMKKLREEMETRNELVKISLQDGDYCNKQLLNIYHYYVECGGKKIFTKDQLEDAKKLIKEYLTNATIYKTEFTWENATSQAMDLQWNIVECTIDKYVEENMSYYAKLNFMDETPQLGTPDMDFLLIHSQKYVNMLERQLAESANQMSDRVERAMLALPQDDKSKSERNSKVNALYKERKALLDKEFTQRISNLKETSEKNTKDIMKNLQDNFEKNLASKLAEKEVTIQEKFDKLIAAKVKEEEGKMHTQLEEMRMKLLAVEDKLNARLKAERETRRSHELYAAGMALLAATKKGHPAVKVDKELRAIEKASGDGDKLVLSVLHGIPDQVWDRGLVPESVLRERFKSMEKVAMKVALVEYEGAPLPIYLLSWLQALLLCIKFTSIPQTEVDNPPLEPNKNLDTFDLLQRARFWLDRGNLALALRYVAALQGASRVAAGRWHDDAKVHVEIRQAAEALMAHAAALGLQYV